MAWYASPSWTHTIRSFAWKSNRLRRRYTRCPIKRPIPSERRDGERYLTLFRVGSVMIEDRRELCLIKNISAGGMMIRPYCKLEPGALVSVELKRGEQIPGTVNWVRDDSAGVTFDEPIDVVELLATSMEGPRPRMPRVEVRCIASVRQGSNVYGMRAHDVSQGGLKVESSRDLEVGAEVLVDSCPAFPQSRPWSAGAKAGPTESPSSACWRSPSSSNGFGISANC